MKYKILRGKSQYVENELNKLSIDNSIRIDGITVHESRLTVIVVIHDKDEVMKKEYKLKRLNQEI